MKSRFLLGWLILIPALAILVVWGARTVDMYKTLGLRNLGSSTLGGITLEEVSKLQFQYLAHQVQKEIRLAVFGRSTDLPRIHLFVRNADISALDAELPDSGFNYVEGRFFDGNDFLDVKVRYRGDYATHWGFFKKSWRIKTKRKDLFQGIRKFNLITPKNELMFANHFGYELARELEILAPKSEMVVLNLNGQEQGIYLLVQQIDESLLRDHERLPGDIYSGDIRYGQDAWSPLGKRLFETPGVWKKVAINNHYPETNRYPLEQLLLAIKQQDLDTLEDLVDLDAFARQALWENLAYSRHIDATHNWRLYFDPGRAKFYPILWDGIPFSKYWIPGVWQNDGWIPREMSGESPLMALLNTSPEFQAHRYRVTEEFLSGDSPEKLRQELASLSERISSEVINDFPMDIGLQWVDPEDAIRRISGTPQLFNKILEGVRTRLSQSQLADNVQNIDQEVWSGTVDITDDVTISSDLVIEEGTSITLAPGASLYLHGKVTINGSAEKPVVFNSRDDSSFGGIVIEGERASGSSLRHVQISNGSGIRTPLRLYSGMLSIHDVPNISLEHCLLFDNTLFDDQLHVVYSTIRISSCEFRNAPMDAIDLDASVAQIENSSFIANGNDGLDLMHSKVVAEQLDFEANGDKGISIGERSHLEIKDSRFSRNHIAMQVKDGSRAWARDLSIRDSHIAINAYAKNWRYGDGGHGSICGSDIESVGTVSLADKKSSIELYDVCPDEWLSDARVVRP